MDVVHDLLHVRVMRRRHTAEDLHQISSCAPPVSRTCSLGGEVDTLGSKFTGTQRLTLFLTFGVVALHQARFPDLYVEGFVLLILLVINYFHVDGFTEEEEEEEGKEEKEEK